MTIIFISIWCIYVTFFCFLDENIFYLWHKFSGTLDDLDQIYECASRMVTKKKDWFLPICVLWPYTNNNGNLIFNFEEFDLIKCRLIYARKNIETQTTTKYFKLQFDTLCLIFTVQFMLQAEKMNRYKELYIRFISIFPEMMH